jgi:predicted dehydrogenase
MDVNHVGERYAQGLPDIIDNSYTIVDFANGVRAMLDLCMFADGAEQQEEITAVGGEARLDVFIPSGEIVHSPRVGFMNPKRVDRRVVEVEETALKAGSHHGSTFYQHQEFAQAIRTGHPALVSAHDGLMAVAMGAAAELSAREKRAVEMRELLG